MNSLNRDECKKWQDLGEREREGEINFFTNEGRRRQRECNEKVVEINRSEVGSFERPDITRPTSRENICRKLEAVRKRGMIIIQENLLYRRETVKPNSWKLSLHVWPTFSSSTFTYTHTHVYFCNFCA